MDVTSLLKTDSVLKRIPRHTCPVAILGSGANVYEEVRKLPCTCDFITVNDISMFFDRPVHYIMSMHPEFFPHWTALRKKQNFQEWQPKTVTAASGYEVDIRIPFDLTWMCGTSSLFAVCAALLFDFNPVYLCGIPLDDSPRIFDPPWHMQYDYGNDVIMSSWEYMRDNVFKGRVKSMGGFSKEFLGS